MKTSLRYKSRTMMLAVTALCALAFGVKCAYNNGLFREIGYSTGVLKVPEPDPTVRICSDMDFIPFNKVVAIDRNSRTSPGIDEFVVYGTDGSQRIYTPKDPEFAKISNGDYRREVLKDGQRTKSDSLDLGLDFFW